MFCRAFVSHFSPARPGYITRDTNRRQKLQKELFEQQERGDVLKAKQKHLKENEAAAKRQSKLWRELQTLLDMKKVCAERQQQATMSRKQLHKQDHLIL